MKCYSYAFHQGFLVSETVKVGKNIKEKMEEDKMSKQIVPLDVGYSSKKEGKSNAIILKLRKGKMEWVLYDSLDKEQLKLILELVMHHVNTVK